MLNSPRSLATPDRTRPVPLFVTLMAAPGTIPPVASATEMLIVPVATWVFPGTEKKRKIAHSKTHALKSLIGNSPSARGKPLGRSFELGSRVGVYTQPALFNPEKL